MINTKWTTESKYTQGLRLLGNTPKEKRDGRKQ